MTGFEMMLGLGTWRYCKPFLCPWRYNFVRLCEVELKNTLSGPRSLFAAGLKLRASARKSLSYSNTYLGNMFSFIKEGLEFRYTFIVLLFLVMAMYATKLCTDSLKGLASLTGFGMMFALTNYLVLQVLRFRECQRKRGLQRCRVRSCL